MLRVNSFPRTANIFTSRFLKLFFDETKVDHTPEVMHDFELLLSKDVPQIVIIRDPDQCIPSSEILRRHNSPYDGHTIAYEIERWITWHNRVIENSDHLFLFTFEQIIDNPINCLVSVADILGIKYHDKETMLQHHKERSHVEANLNKGNVFATSQTEKEYENVVNEYNSQDLSQVHYMYKNLISQVEENQKNYDIRLK